MSSGSSWRNGSHISLTVLSPDSSSSAHSSIANITYPVYYTTNTYIAWQIIFFAFFLIYSFFFCCLTRVIFCCISFPLVINKSDPEQNHSLYPSKPFAGQVSTPYFLNFDSTAFSLVHHVIDFLNLFLKFLNLTFA